MKMKKNNTFSEIRIALQEADNILILPHIKADGDAAGSASALLEIFRKKEKKAYALAAETPLPSIQALVHERYRTEIPEGFLPDLLITVDCADIDRCIDRVKYFPDVKILNLDHHGTNTRFGDLDYVIGNLSSTGELIYSLFEALGYKITKKAARYILGAILLDTNRFYYSSTSSRTLEIAAEIIDRGVSMSELCEDLFGNNSKEKMKLLARAIDSSTFFCSNRGVYSWLPREVQLEAGTDNTDDIVEALRDMEGVEVALLLYDYKGSLRASLRSVGDVDVSKVALAFGGGGHKNASGITFTDHDYEKVLRKLLRELEALLVRKS